MKHLIVIMFFCAACVGNTRRNRDCDIILHRKIELDDPHTALANIGKLSGCGLDSTVLSLLGQGPILGTLIVEMPKRGKPHPTYGDLYQALDSTLMQPGYKAITQ